MAFLKKHYEKILLSVVLLILAGTAVWLFVAVEKKRDEVQVSIPPLGNKKIQALDLSSYQKAFERSKNPPSIDFSQPHHLFNPVIWKQSSDGKLFKIVTSDLPRILKTTPLHFTIAFEKTAETGGYQFNVVREAIAKKPDQKRAYVKKGDKGMFFKLKDVQGPPENPTGFVLELNDNKQEVVVTPDQPFKRVDGYAADMKYDIEKKDFNNTRVGDSITFAGETYKVVAIAENEVTVQSISNQKQTTIRKTAP